MPKRLTIYRCFLTENDCYKKATREEIRGVQVHSTGADNPWLKRYVQPDDGRLGVNPNGNSHNRSGGDVCASAYIGRLADGTVAVYQTLPWDVRCWLSGSGKNGNANRMGYRGFEICEDGLKDEGYFRDAVLDKAVALTAYLCQLGGVSPFQVMADFGAQRALAVMDHHELHAAGLASNHADITHWLRNFGLTMNDFRKAVQDLLDGGGVEAEYVDGPEELLPDPPPIYPDEAVTAVVNNPQRWLIVRSAPNGKQLFKVEKGTQVEILAEDDGWYQIRSGSRIGWAWAEYIRIPDRLPEADPQPEEQYPPEEPEISQPDLMAVRETALAIREDLSAMLGRVDGLLDQLDQLEAVNG